MNNPTPPTPNASFKVLYQEIGAPKMGTKVNALLCQWQAGDVRQYVLTTEVETGDPAHPLSRFAQVLDSPDDAKAQRYAMARFDNLMETFREYDDVPFSKAAYMSDEDDELFPHPAPNGSSPDGAPSVAEEDEFPW